jgi:ABC-type multidrug transport system ATPase subunit
MILEIDNIELYFKNKRILNGIYLKAETGEITGVLGSNGTGKTSLLNIIFGNLQPKYKLIRIDNKPVLKPLYQTDMIGFLTQYHFIPRNFKIKTTFALFNILWEDFVKEFTALSINKNSTFNKLSGGERRLVEIFLILKSNKKIILLDEPFSHIAPVYVEKIKRLITEVKKEKVIVITDHLYNHIIDVSDCLYLLKDGHSKRLKDTKELEDYKYLSIGTLT